MKERSRKQVQVQVLVGFLEVSRMFKKRYLLKLLFEGFVCRCVLVWWRVPSSSQACTATCI
jgi:hypothetical protein